jgi:hypothetical protein
MGLGAYPLVPLAMAREMAIEHSLKRLKGIDPLEEREAEKRQQAKAAVKSITFEKAAKQYIAAHEAGWKNEVHRKQWTSWIAAVLTLQAGLGVVLGVTVQALIGWGLIFYAMPAVGLGLLDLARGLAELDLPARLIHLIAGAP